MYGLAPSAANYIRPAKKPLSSMAPLVVEQGGALRAVLGASGGPRIVSTVLQAVLRALVEGEDAFAGGAGGRAGLLPQGEGWLLTVCPGLHKSG